MIQYIFYILASVFLSSYYSYSCCWYHDVECVLVSVYSHLLHICLDASHFQLNLLRVWKLRHLTAQSFEFQKKSSANMFSIVKAREKCLYNLVIANHMWYMFVYLCPLTYAKFFFFAAEFPNNLFGKSRVSLNLRWGLVTVWFPWMSQRIFGFCLPNRGHKRQKHASDGQVTHIDSHWLTWRCHDSPY